jgi:hypothetical protein
MIRSLVGTSILCIVIGAGVSLAQTPANQPAAATSGTRDKQAISKSCSDQANAKGLHGKERKKFRFDCKKGGGKAP